MRFNPFAQILSTSSARYRAIATKADARRKLLKAKARQPRIDERLLPIVSLSCNESQFLPCSNSSQHLELIIQGSNMQVAIVGKPNVGKSALFNRLVQRADALVIIWKIHSLSKKDESLQ